MESTRSLARGLALLEHVAAFPGGCGFAALARSLALPNTTLSRLLRSLIALGYLRRNPQDGLYRPGDRLGWLGMQEDAEMRLRRCCHGSLHELAARTGLCTLLLRWTGRHVVCIESVPGPGLPHYQRTGHVTIDLPSAPWGLFFDRGQSLAGLSPTQRRERASELRRLRRQGWTRCWKSDRRRIAAPVRDGHGETVGALVLVGPPDRVDRQLTRLGSLLAATALHCSVPGRRSISSVG